MKIASNTQELDTLHMPRVLPNLITFYNTWKDAKNLYQNSSNEPVLINDPEGIPCFHYLDKKNINQCEKPIVAIDCLTEGLHSIEHFRKYRTDHHYIIFSNGDWDIDRWNLGISYTLIYYPYFLFEMADTYNSPQRFCYYLDKEYIFDYPKSLSFVSTIGTVKPLRDLFVTKILSRLDRNRFILRYSGQDQSAVSSDDFDPIKFVPGEFDPYTPIIEKYYHNVSQTLPVNLYNQSYFNLIVETDCDFNDSFFLTEKTIKSLITGQPFVVLSNPDHLKNLRKLGFRTFDKLWNEHYDSIIDFESRTDAIVQLCEYLSLEFDWQLNKSQLEEIKMHNRQVFQNLGFLADRCFDEIEKKLRKFD